MSEVIITSGERPLREVNQEIHAELGKGSAVVVRDTRSRHNLGIGLPADARIRFEGSVGYYCGGLNNGAHVEIERNAGWGVGEAMASGSIVVNGYAGMSAGASMLGGLIHIKGDAGPRCGVAMKGGDIIVEGKIGYLSGFMAHAGRIIALGGADGACADSLWGGEVWLPGPSSRSASTPRSSSRSPRKSRTSRSCSQAGASTTPAATGRRSFPPSGSGISKAGTQPHG